MCVLVWRKNVKLSSEKGSCASVAPKFIFELLDPQKPVALITICKSHLHNKIIKNFLHPVYFTLSAFLFVYINFIFISAVNRFKFLKG